MFYDTFKDLCDARGISCKKAAIEIGLSNSLPTAWKKRGLTPKADTLSKIADYFGIPVDYLLGHYPTLDMYEVVSYLCRKNGISIRQMCNATGVSESTISNLKHKRLTRLSNSDQVAIADYFQISTDVFCEGVLEDTLPNQADAESIAGFHYLQKENPPAVSDEGNKKELLIKYINHMNQDQLDQAGAFLKWLLSNPEK